MRSPVNDGFLPSDGAESLVRQDSRLRYFLLPAVLQERTLLFGVLLSAVAHTVNVWIGVWMQIILSCEHASTRNTLVEVNQLIFF